MLPAQPQPLVPGTPKPVPPLLPDELPPTRAAGPAPWLDSLPALDVNTDEFREHSVDILALLGASHPLCHVLPFHGLGVTRFQDVEAILRDPQTFSSRVRAAPPIPGSEEAAAFSALIKDDPPRHTRLRTLAGHAFTPPRVAAMQTRIEEIVRELVDGILERGTPLELVRDLAVPLPVTVIADLLGIDPADKAKFQRWSDDLIGAVLAHAIPEEPARLRRFAQITASMQEMEAYLGDVMRQRRTKPGPDIISALVEAADNHESLTTQEVLGLTKLLLVAGNETTTKLITLAMNQLLRHPDQAARLHQDPSLAAGVVEETLRYEGPVAFVVRLATQDTRVAGCAVPAGTLVLPLLGAANHDRQVFPSPDVFDMGRTIRRHLGFGWGIHQCLGAPLARLEARLALEDLFARLQDFHPVAPPTRVVSAFRGFAEMRLEYRPRRPRTPDITAEVAARVATAERVAHQTDRELGLDKRATMTVRVANIRDVAMGVKLLRLVHPSGGLLPQFTAGSHLVLHLRDGARTYRNAYSLLNSGYGDGLSYFLAVALARDSKGGSRFIHQGLQRGVELLVSAPANNFPLAQPGVASKHLLLAGGIGVTPLFALRNACRLRGEPCELHYAFRDRESAALVSELEMEFDPHVHCYDNSRGQRLHVENVIRLQPEGTHLYVCGPESLMQEAIDRALQGGWSKERIHFERFGAARPAGEAPFEVVCARSGKHLVVPGDLTLLEALEQAGLEVPCGCRAGSCGSCSVHVLAGEPDHRDSLLTDQERAEGRILVCVSRARGRLVLDI